MMILTGTQVVMLTPEEEVLQREGRLRVVETRTEVMLLVDEAIRWRTTKDPPPVLAPRPRPQDMVSGSYPPNYRRRF